MEKENRIPYYKFSTYLKEQFGCQVHKVSIDAGFSCPNKDMTKSAEGCIYCDNRGFSYSVRNNLLKSSISSFSADNSNKMHFVQKSVDSQIEEGIKFGRRRFNAQKFIVYFQAYTNTYAPLKVLKEKYDIIKKFNDVVGISIGTRPDCINTEIIDLIETYTHDYEVWIEYGLQTVHKKTLEFINRGHSYEDFLNAVQLTRQRKNIKICTHIIIGLPDETKTDILETAKALGQIKVDGIKIHPLHIIEGTKLEQLYNQNCYKPLELDEYVDLAVEFLEYLWPNTVIQRMTADCPEELLIAPLWVREKNKVLNEIDKRFLKKNTFQGAKYC